MTSVVCAVCATVFIKGGRGGPKYCSLPCRRLAKWRLLPAEVRSGRNRRRLHQARAGRVPHKCVLCGGDIPWHGRGKYVYCSGQCRRLYRRADQSLTAQCVRCGASFQKVRAGRGMCPQKYCSHRCLRDSAGKAARKTARDLELQKKAAERAHQAQALLRSALPCRQCGGVIPPARVVATGGAAKYCSTGCLKRVVNKKKNRKKQPFRSLRKRIQKFGSEYERIDPIEVFRAANWTCQICGVHTPARLRGTHDDRAPELEHIRPLARGGSHTRDNVQCACRQCNHEKSDQILNIKPHKRAKPLTVLPLFSPSVCSGVAGG